MNELIGPTPKENIRYHDSLITNPVLRYSRELRAAGGLAPAETGIIPDELSGIANRVLQVAAVATSFVGVGLGAHYVLDHMTPGVAHAGGPDNTPQSLGPDLTAEAVACVKRSVVGPQYDTLKMHVTVSNTGLTPAGWSVVETQATGKLWNGDNAPEVGTLVPPLGPGESFEIDGTGGTYQKGTVIMFRATADAGETVHEANEANNTISVPVEPCPIVTKREIPIATPEARLIHNP